MPGQSTQPSNLSPNNTQPKLASTSIISSRGKLFLIVIILLTLLGIGLYEFSTSKNSSSKTNQATTKFPLSTPSNLPIGAKDGKAIAQIGTETVYQTDLNTELAAQPPSSNSAALKKVLLDKIITDSIILQGYSADNKLTLDSTVFNSPTKDYYQRVHLVAQIKQKISDQYSNLSGKVISIWFDNNRPTTDGDEERKQLALQKITPLQQEVKSGQITIDQAADKIKNDSSLASLDTAYKTNALLEFSVPPNIPPTIDSNFNQVLRSLSVEQVSEVYLAKANQLNTNQLIDALYMFGVITKKDAPTLSFDAWLSQKRKLYAVSVY